VRIFTGNLRAVRRSAACPRGSLYRALPSVRRSLARCCPSRWSRSRLSRLLPPLPRASPRLARAYGRSPPD